MKLKMKFEKFSEALLENLLTRVEQGQSIIIRRKGKAIARMVPLESSPHTSSSAQRAASPRTARRVAKVEPRKRADQTVRLEEVESV